MVIWAYFKGAGCSLKIKLSSFEVSFSTAASELISSANAVIFISCFFFKGNLQQLLPAFLSLVAVISVRLVMWLT